MSEQTTITRWMYHSTRFGIDYTARRLVRFDPERRLWAVCHDQTAIEHYNTEEQAINTLMRWGYTQALTEDHAAQALNAELLGALQACYAALMNETPVGVRSAEKKMAALVLDKADRQ